eukprot:jgi/Mesvir1/3645/Mv14941-RA.1
MAAKMIFVVVAILAIAAGANAATITHVDEYGFVRTNWNTVLELPQFNPALGTLTSTTVTMFGEVVGTASLENLEANPIEITLNLAARITVTYPTSSGLGQLGQITPTRSVNATRAGYDGTGDFGGASGAIYPNLRGSDSQSQTITNPATLNSVFTGTGNIVFPADAQAASRSTGSGNTLVGYQTEALCRVTVIYTYQPVVVPPPPEPSIRSDPHFVAGNGLKYDFMGEAGKTYCMFSDKLVHMNMKMMGAKNDANRKATWMESVSIAYWPYYNITISAESPEGTPFTAAHGTVSVNGKEMKSQKLSTMVRWHGLTVTRRKTRTTVAISNLLNVEFEVVRATFWEGKEGPGANYLNVKIVGLNVTDNVHGVLGQTFRESFDVTEVKDTKAKMGEGVIAGKENAEAVAAALSMHKWEGEAGADSDNPNAYGGAQ